MGKTETVSANVEQQNVTQLYKSLSASDRIIFKSILEMKLSITLDTISTRILKLSSDCQS